MTESPAAAAREPVSLAVVNARVWTGTARRPWADAVAVRGDRLAVVGSGAEARKLGAARVVDAKGTTLLPGRSEAPHDDVAPWSAAIAAARALADGWTGATLERGGMADFVLLDRDVTHASVSEPACVVLVVVGGRIVFERDAASHTE